MKTIRQAVGAIIGLVATGAFLLQLVFALAPVTNWPVLGVYIAIGVGALAFLLASEE